MTITSIHNSEINQRIDQQLERFGQLYLVVDPKINDLFFFDNQYQFDSVVPVRDRQDTVSADHECLQLCCLKKAMCPSINEVTALLQNTDSSVIAMLFSTYSLDEIQKQMSNAMFMTHQGAYYLLRYYDPKVLKHLTAIFEPTQLSQLLGVIEYWYYWNDDYVELAHQPERILSDIDYQMTHKQFQKLAMAQSYNYYENLTAKKQNRVLSLDQQQNLAKLFDWIYANPYNQPDKKIMDEVIHFAMACPQQFWQIANHDLIEKMMNGQQNEITEYFAGLAQGVNDGIA